MQHSVNIGSPYPPVRPYLDKRQQSALTHIDHMLA
jgi:hypothetical protein